MQNENGTSISFDVSKFKNGDKSWKDNLEMKKIVRSLGGVKAVSKMMNVSERTIQRGISKNYLNVGLLKVIGIGVKMFIDKENCLITLNESAKEFLLCELMDKKGYSRDDIASLCGFGFEAFDVLEALEGNGQISAFHALQMINLAGGSIKYLTLQDISINNGE